MEIIKASRGHDVIFNYPEEDLLVGDIDVSDGQVLFIPASVNAGFTVENLHSIISTMNKINYDLS